MYEDMPFTLINSDEAPTDCTLVPQSAGRYSVMIALTTSHVKQIDEKYIPLVEDSFETIASVKNFENDSEYVMESIELNTNTVMLSINGDERSITLSGIDGNY
jgi:hypothetical protein